ncbi:hypothetical protein BC834DRAFT_372336 [Gloeopeniophorella convolvens]|nr:hypothetical protein BC834DRAFT_372336 [Gloeopeniophorella convolvens]
MPPKKKRSSIEWPTQKTADDQFSAGRAAADEEIDTLSKRLLILKSKRNALMPIALLPPEILSQIFHVLSLVHPSKTSTLGVIRMSHVCKTWRSVALGDMLLWRRVPFNLGWSCTREVLARSGRTQLILAHYFDVLGGKDKRSNILPGLMPRMERLSLSFLAYERSYIKELLNSPAPVLENVRLEFASSPHDSSLVDGPALFGQSAPRLREITLVCVSIPWDRFPRSPLVNLNVDFAPAYPVGSPFTMDSLLDLLSHCAGTLERLTLRCCLPTSQLRPIQHRTVSLIQLKRITLMGRTTDMAITLQSLELPSDTMMQLQCADRIREESDLFPILPLLMGRLSHADSPPIRSVGIEIVSTGSGGRLELAFARHPQYFHKDQLIWDPWPSRSSSGADISISCYLSPRASYSLVLLYLFSALLTPEAHHLYVRITGTVHTIDWKLLLRRYSKINTIVVKGQDSYTLLQTLSTTELTPLTSSSPHSVHTGHGDQSEGAQTPISTPSVMRYLICPHLTRVFIRTIAFNRPLPGKRAVLLNNFVSVLRTRRLYNSQLEELCIHRCAFNKEDDVKKFDKVVQKLVWDGRVLQ